MFSKSEFHSNVHSIEPQNNEAIHVYTTSHGNRISIICEYPDINPVNYLDDITSALTYSGVFQGISDKDAYLQ